MFNYKSSSLYQRTEVHDTILSFSSRSFFFQYALKVYITKNNLNVWHGKTKEVFNNINAFAKQRSSPDLSLYGN